MPFLSSYRRTTVELREVYGYAINHKVVQKLYKEWDLPLIHNIKPPKPFGVRQSIGEFVEYYNEHRYHESLDNPKPEDVYFGREAKVKIKREKIKQSSLPHRGKWNLGSQSFEPVSPYPRWETLS